MHLDGYEFSFDERTNEYVFFSKGVKGVIEKTIKFDKVGKDLFNLSFGDVHPITGQLNDKIITNNGDRQKVLITVAKAVLDFLKFNPYATVIAFGSTASRTRLYQMNINLYYFHISQLFEIKGFKNNQLELFVAGKNYDGFSICVKEKN